jgi:hypothetical protein
MRPLLPFLTLVALGCSGDPLAPYVPRPAAGDPRLLCVPAGLTVVDLTDRGAILLREPPAEPRVYEVPGRRVAECGSAPVECPCDPRRSP